MFTYLGKINPNVYYLTSNYYFVLAVYYANLAVLLATVSISNPGFKTQPGYNKSNTYKHTVHK